MSARQFELPPLPDPEIHTVENFIHFWGDRSSFSAKETYALFESAEKQYIDLPYHNFSHAKATLWEAMRLADACEKNGVSVNRKALAAAALFHDAGFHLDSKALGHSSQEDLSIDIFAEEAGAKYGFTIAESITAIEAIKATECGIKPVTLEQKILVRADLANVFSDTRTFLASSYKLYMENQGSNKLPVSPKGQAKFINDSIQILKKYLENDLSLGPWEERSWRDQAESNLSVLGSIRNLSSFGGSLINRLVRRDPSDS
jgi:HD superfamily phosphodiesterase